MATIGFRLQRAGRRAAPVRHDRSGVVAVDCGQGKGRGVKGKTGFVPFSEPTLLLYLVPNHAYTIGIRGYPMTWKAQATDRLFRRGNSRGLQWCGNSRCAYNLIHSPGTGSFNRVGARHFTEKTIPWNRDGRHPHSKSHPSRDVASVGG